jgi:hypothetical protein
VAGALGRPSLIPRPEHAAHAWKTGTTPVTEELLLFPRRLAVASEFDVAHPSKSVWTADSTMNSLLRPVALELGPAAPVETRGVV